MPAVVVVPCTCACTIEKVLKKNEAAAALAHARWKNTSAEERSETARSIVSARWDKATKEERVALGKRLADARAKVRKTRSKATEVQ